MMPDVHACTCEAKILSSGQVNGYPECASNPVISVRIDESGICDNGPDCPPSETPKRPCAFVLEWTYTGSCATSHFNLYQWDGSGWVDRGLQAFGADPVQKNFEFNPWCGEKWKVEFSFDAGTVHWACEVECKKCGAALGGGDGI